MIALSKYVYTSKKACKILKIIVSMEYEIQTTGLNEASNYTEVQVICLLPQPMLVTC